MSVFPEYATAVPSSKHTYTLVVQTSFLRNPVVWTLHVFEPYIHSAHDIRPCLKKIDVSPRENDKEELAADHVGSVPRKQMTSCVELISQISSSFVYETLVREKHSDIVWSRHKSDHLHHV